MGVRLADLLNESDLVGGIDVTGDGISLDQSGLVAGLDESGLT
jgi:hypothetical protein